MSKPLPSWASIIPGTNPPKPPPGGWALPNGTTPGFLAVSLARIEDAQMRPEKRSYEEQTEHERQLEIARREYDAMCDGRKDT